MYQIHGTIIGQLSSTTGRDEEKLFLAAQARFCFRFSPS
jgi:hypothetical protein